MLNREIQTKQAIPFRYTETLSQFPLAVNLFVPCLCTPLPYCGQRVPTLPTNVLLRFRERCPAVVLDVV